MELRQVPPAGRPFIEAYSEEGFRIGVERFTGGVLVLLERVIGWQPTEPTSPTLADLGPLADEPAEILIIGTGAKHQQLDPDLRAELRARGIGVETMATAAACRTFNVLLGEDRRVVAALLPVSQ